MEGTLFEYICCSIDFMFLAADDNSSSNFRLPVNVKFAWLLNLRSFEGRESH